MRILILGQSNSILSAGYVIGLHAQLHGAKIVNKSVGASVGLQYAYYGRERFSQFDFVLFENVINDELFVDQCGGIDLFKSVYVELFSTISAQTRLYIIGFSSRRFLDAPSDMYYLHEDIAEHVGANFISVRDFILERGAKIVPEGDPLMQDNDHPHLAIAQQFGHYLGQVLKRHLVVERRLSKYHANNYARNFQRVALGHIFEKATVFRATSHLGRRFALLRIGDVIALKEPIVPLGFYLDRGRTRAYVRLSGRDSDLTKRLYYHADGPKLEMRFTPMRRRIEVSHLEVVEPADEFEEGLGSFTQTVAHNAIASISGIVGWSGTVQHWSFSGRGAPTTPKPGALCTDGPTVFEANEMPVGAEWLPAVQRGDGRWVRLTGPDRYSTLNIALPPRRFRLQLYVLGGASAECVLGLRFFIRDWPLETRVARDSGGAWVAEAIVESDPLAHLEVGVFVPDKRQGAGVVVWKLAIHPFD